MTWRRWIAGFVGFLLLLLGGAAALLWTAARPPEFYREAVAAPANREERRTRAKEMERRTVQLVEEVKSSDSWKHEFDQNQINAWLAEELESRFGKEIPSEVRDPRVRLVDGAVDLAFRVVDPKRRGETVVTLRVAPRVVGPNRLELEIVSIKAGLLPLPVDTIITRAVDRLKATRWNITRRTRDGRDVFDLDLSAGLPPGAVLKNLVVEDGRAEVEGEREKPATGAAK